MGILVFLLFLFMLKTNMLYESHFLMSLFLLLDFILVFLLYAGVILMLSDSLMKN